MTYFSVEMKITERQAKIASKHGYSSRDLIDAVKIRADTYFGTKMDDGYDPIWDKKMEDKFGESNVEVMNVANDIFKNMIDSLVEGVTNYE